MGRGHLGRGANPAPGGGRSRSSPRGAGIGRSPTSSSCSPAHPHPKVKRAGCSGRSALRSPAARPPMSMSSWKRPGASASSGRSAPTVATSPSGSLTDSTAADCLGSDEGRAGSTPGYPRRVNPTLRPVVLSGRVGTRLWPLSTKDTPKQFLELLGEPLFAATWAGSRNSLGPARSS